MKNSNNGYGRRNKMTQYEVWQIEGGYFNSFAKYSDACELRDTLQKEYPNAKIIIKQKEIYD